MPETLEQILQQTSSETTPAAETTQTESTNTTPEGVTPASQVEDIPQNVRAHLEKHPDHKPIADVLNREFQSAFTPRLQEAAELKKLVDGLDPNAINTLRQLQQLSQTHPEQVAQWYRAQADLLAGNNPTPTNG